MDSRRTSLLSINALACVKAEIWRHAQEYAQLLHCTESLMHNNIYMLY